MLAYKLYPKEYRLKTTQLSLAYVFFINLLDHLSPYHITSYIGRLVFLSSVAVLVSIDKDVGHKIGQNEITKVCGFQGHVGCSVYQQQQKLFL